MFVMWRGGKWVWGWCGGGGGGGLIYPQTTICAAISEPLGISGRAFATFPEYELATGWRFQTIFDTFQESNMAAGKPENAWKSA